MKRAGGAGVELKTSNWLNTLARSGSTCEASGEGTAGAERSWLLVVNRWEIGCSDAHHETGGRREVVLRVRLLEKLGACCDRGLYLMFLQATERRRQRHSSLENRRG